ncbi:unnamed protein product [Brassicogethes aeneus]|uniref:Phorbol-ester/DAG-type domain-containing protein n=1 Tax=Brassicogethes aeneus TaxID=1431903 RepID=A0A9P0FI08_BRAAE|nr:unnamed protein product [Brassicogethes aeneus]
MADTKTANLKCTEKLIAKPCKRCKHVAQNGLKCVSCGAVSHQSCVKLLKDVEIINSEEFICCGDLTSNDANLSSSTNSTENSSETVINALESNLNTPDRIMESLLRENAVLEAENRLLRSLIQEKDEKNDLLRENFEIRS